MATNALFSLEGQTALITGGTRGIGQAIAIALAEAGADVLLVQVRAVIPSQPNFPLKMCQPETDRNSPNSNRETSQTSPHSSQSKP